LGRSATKKNRMCQCRCSVWSINFCFVQSTTTLSTVLCSGVRSVFTFHLFTSGQILTYGCFPTQDVYCDLAVAEKHRPKSCGVSVFKKLCKNVFKNTSQNIVCEGVVKLATALLSITKPQWYRRVTQGKKEHQHQTVTPAFVSMYRE
jgi:hypothetical protein